VKKLILIFIYFFNVVCCTGQNIEGKWFFKSILADSLSIGKDIKPINEGDYMIINANGQFSYQLSKLGLLANGQWSLNQNKLIFKYENPYDTVRLYTITLQNQLLVLNEEGINFTFSKNNNQYLESTFSFANIFRGIFGILVLVFISFIFSRNKRAIDWRLVIKGLLIQFLFAALILKVPFIQDGFEWISSVFVTILGFTRQGSIFLFGSLIENIDSFGFIFAFQVLPTILFFSALTSLLFYYGILQKLIFGCALFMKRIMNLSGSESLAAAGNIFLGQTESPLLIKPYISKMTMSELLCLMGGGMATIAGGVLAAYIGFLGGDDPIQQVFFAKHLLAASVMSAPAAIVAAKILLPETEKINTEMSISKEQIGTNALEAISIGTIQGLKLAVNVGAMLLVFIAIITMINYFLEDFLGSYTGVNEWVSSISNGQYNGLTMQFLLGYAFAPLSWVMGVCKEDIVLVGQLLGEKTILNEFVAYVSLSEFSQKAMFYSERSIIIATYILCGFANFSSIGIQIGGIGSLAPERTKDLSSLGILALIVGTLASLYTAVIVGMLI